MTSTAARITLDLSQLAPILRDLNLAAPSALVQLKQSTSPVYRADLTDGTSVIIKTFDAFLYDAPAKETYASRLLADLDVPITRFLAFDETRTRLPFRYSIASYLPGETVATFRSEPDVADLYRQMGQLLRRLHTVRLPAFGRFDANGLVDPLPTNEAFVLRLWDGALDRFRHYGADPDLAAALDRIVRARLDLVRHSSGPVFAHDDMQPNNVLAERDGAGHLRLTGLIDFGNARAADPLFDLAKTLFCCEHEAPGSGAAIREGYGPIDHPDPAAALWLYTLIHRVVMWYWLRHVGIIPDAAAKHDLIADLEAMAAEV